MRRESLAYTPHAAQREIHEARKRNRFLTVCCGRRFGKTLCMAAEVLDSGGMYRAGDYGWVAPTYGVAERGVEACRELGAGFVRVVGRMPARVEFGGLLGPCRIWFLSADNPDSIRGFGFQGLVVDEAAAVPVDVWNYALRPTLAQTYGWAVFISTPSGRNWFFDMHTRGLEGQEGYGSFTFPSNVSPYFPPREWDEARRTLPEDVFRQEYMAEFLEDSAGVFRGVEGCLLPELEIRNEESGVKRRGATVVGIDLAKHTDWTVCLAMDAESGRCLEMERFNNLDWPVQKRRIAEFCRRWPGLVVMDSTGVGDPVFDDLAAEFPGLEGYRFTAQSKRALVQGLMVAVEQRRVSWPAGRKEDVSHEGTKGTKGNLSQDARIDGIGCGPWEVLTNEMKRYEYRIGPTGQISYDAPSGYHDDCVMALALAWHGRASASAVPGGMAALAAGFGRFARRGRVLMGV